MTETTKKIINLAPYIDQTLLRATATDEEIIKLCEGAVKYSFKGVCTNSRFTRMVAQALAGTDVLQVTVIGFPLGAVSTEVKKFEAHYAVENGAQELDMVISLGAVKEKNWKFVEDDIRAVCSISPMAVKVILETCLLTNDEIIESCKVAEQAGASYVKTSTGFSTSGAQLEHIRLMKKSVSSLVGVKASGGIKTREQAIQFIDAGATRIGTSNGEQLLLGQEILSSTY